MPTGVIVDSLAVLFGGLIGSLLSKRINEQLKTNLTLMFGLCAIAIGIKSIIVLVNLPVVILSVIIGSAIGVSLKFEERVSKLLEVFEKPLKSFSNVNNQDEYISGLITVLVLFCASATGIFGSLDSGFSGDHTILFSKAIMDFFTAVIFACNYGNVISLISIPQFVVYLIIFLLARLIFPHTTDTMIADCKGCGGLLTLANGYRVMKGINFPGVDMIPSLLIVMPLSALWSIIM